MASEEIERLTQDGIIGHRVDGEIPAAGSFPWRDAFIEDGMEIAMPLAGLAFPPGHAEVHAAGFGPEQLHDAKAFPHQIDSAVGGQEPGQAIVGDAVDLDIEVLGLPSEEGVTYRAPDDQAAKSGGIQVPQDPFERGWNRQEHIGSIDLSSS